MARVAAVQRRPRRTIIGATAVVAVVALITTLAVTADGYDAQETPRLESSVWVTRGDGQYARVNTDLGEIDTVRSVEDPSNVIQSGDKAYVLTQNNRLLWPVDAASPVDFTSASTAEGDAAAAASDSSNTPQGTRSIATAGSYVAYLTDTNAVFLGRVPDSDSADSGDPSSVVAVDPYAELYDEEDDNAPVYSATAVAVSASGALVVYSADEQSIRRFDATTGTFDDRAIAVPSPPDSADAVELALIGDTWVLSDAAQSTIWLEGQDPIDTGLTAAAVLQASSDSGDRVYLADQNGLISVDLESGEVSSAAAASGTPAQPVIVDSVAYAAWLDTTAGTLWSSETGETTALDVAEGELDDVQTIVPVIRSNGMRAVLSELGSGLLWTVPGGTAIPLEQWSLDDAELDAGTIQVDDVAEEKPPVAVADSFGVRAGSLVRLPLLLNDHDPNKKDVLSIDAASISALDNAGLGEIGLISNNQEAVIRVRADSGSATFSYAVTDGQQKSAPVQVTLTVVPSGQNTAPVWCGVEACAQVWPTPQIAAGGTITVPVLTGWVDPEGDALVLTDARKDNVDDPVTVVPTADGSVAIRHLDPNAAGQTVPITITVSDSGGLVSVMTLELTVTSSPGLTVDPVAIVAGAGEKHVVAIADHVSGGSGSYRLLDASTVAEGLLVVPNAAAGAIELTASAAGEYSLSYTVQDEISRAEHTAVIRVSVPGESALTMAPLTTFVRANEDTTVDVLGAVQNTTGRVLLVSSAISGDPSLRVNVVGQSSVRVSGSTANGLPGKIGTAVITVTDGAGAIVEGTLTVFLAPPSTGVGAIAVPDTATVRAGGQIDIPVTANDVSPRGERLLVHPKVETSEAKGELAFVTGDTVRYLAPATEGTYTLRYSVYLGNEPTRLDTTTITVTVTPAGSNRPPQPPILAARVLSGETVSIPVDSYGMDPDGDSVVLAGVTQPRAGQGVASISADGTAIVYTATGNGISGAQVSFDYTVRDSEGAEADGAVRVGVLNADLSDSAPITYSDYSRAQKGATDPVTVVPLLNDSDPAGGTLTLVSLEPNIPALDTNPEYARLKSLIISDPTPADGIIQLAAGDVLGTHSYKYVVKSSISTSTSDGLIVVTVSDAGALDYPEVSDTVLTAKSRNQLATGIDVVTGKVQWPTGDTSKLKLKLWGSGTSGYSVSGQSISGSLPKKGAVLPFSLTGTDAAGNAVVSYGFLRIPAFDDMRLQIKPTMRAIEVGEEKSVEFDVLDVLDLDASEVVDVRDDAEFVVQRANSSCDLTGSTSATYSAGREAPWTDYCAVPVRLQGQSHWTILAVPITIAPKDPLAQLNAVTRTVAPGSSDIVNYYEDLTSWQGGRVGDKSILDYATAFGGSSFIVTTTATGVSIDARADAVPGTRETIQVSVSSYGGLSTAITLVVGIAAPDTPRGATFTQQCVVSSGPSCAITVIGQPGQYDPFEGKAGSGLKVVSVGTGAAGGGITCPVATVAVSSDTKIVATYPAGPKPAGGTCIVPYTVKDAQGRTGAGQVTIDVQGYPAKPQSITTQSYTATSVTMTVTLGAEAALSHPSVTSVKILEGGSVVAASCVDQTNGSYRCTITGLENGVEHLYTARAVNSVGDSLDTTVVATNAYETPQVLTYTAKSMYDTGVTITNARVELTITADVSTESFRVVQSGAVIPKALSGATVLTVNVPAGATDIKIIPVSKFKPPTSPNKGEGIQYSPTSWPGHVGIGLPTFGPSVSAAPTGDTEISVNVTFNDNHAGFQKLVYFAWRGGSAPSCTVPSAAGGLVYSANGASVSVDNNAITVPEAYLTYNILVCGTNNFGAVVSSGTTAFAGTTKPAAPTGTLTYLVDPAGTVSGRVVDYATVTAPVVAAAPTNFSTFYVINGTKSPAFALSLSTNPTSITAVYCATDSPSFCSDPSAQITTSGANSIARVTFPPCAPAFPDDSDVDIAGGYINSNVQIDKNIVLSVLVSAKYTVKWQAGRLDDAVSADIPACVP